MLRKVCIAASLAPLALAAPAAAQSDGWQVSDLGTAGRQSAMVCPLNDGATGNALCFTVGCMPDGPLEFRVFAVGGDMPDRLEARLSVDGGSPWPLSFAPVESRFTFEYAAAYDRDAHGPLLAALKAGSRAWLAYPAGTGEATWEMSLRGSSRSISAIEGQCPLPVPPAVADPAAETLAELARECADFGGTIDMLEGYVRRPDLNADGVADMVIDFGAAQCPTAASLHCGSAGCFQTVWLARAEGGFDQVYRGNFHGLEPRPGGGFDLALHGSFCGKLGYEACSWSFGFDGRQLVRLD